ncbi:hypothetical protein CC78DRAFT_530175 [Lojkania enalia]|uniref:Uncharacterized protein n=1 Tax=Lojkania enalia TaxID=147567 RepID=A0A9P4KJ99_9PLEO|nr:hypothetical protein CC78DRAFT_530175 [Didymosphaeria enalia]
MVTGCWEVRCAVLIGVREVGGGGVNGSRCWGRGLVSWELCYLVEPRNVNLGCNSSKLVGGFIFGLRPTPYIRKQTHAHIHRPHPTREHLNYVLQYDCAVRHSSVQSDREHIPATGKPQYKSIKMSLFPNVYASATYTDTPHTMTHNQPSSRRRSSTLFAHLFSPTSFHSLSPTKFIHHDDTTQSTSSKKRAMTGVERAVSKGHVEGEEVFVEEAVEECDGGPLCREAEIEKWKCEGCERNKKMKEGRRRMMMRRTKSMPA